LDEGEDLHDAIDPNEDAIDSNNPDEGQDEFDESSDEDVDISAVPMIILHRVNKDSKMS
jgi:hypothetical protein